MVAGIEAREAETHEASRASNWAHRQHLRPMSISRLIKVKWLLKLIERREAGGDKELNNLKDARRANSMRIEPKEACLYTT